MSNRDIARNLVISESTAANHVRSIFLKTGATNPNAGGPLRRGAQLAGVTGGQSGSSTPVGRTMSVTSTMTSAGTSACSAALRMALADDASYRQ